MRASHSINLLPSLVFASAAHQDSLRVFPISLDKLCKMFHVDGKLIGAGGQYNSNFSTIELFKDPLLLQNLLGPEASIVYNTPNLYLML